MESPYPIIYHHRTTFAHEPQFYTSLRVNMQSAYTRPRCEAFHGLELRNGQVLQQWWDDAIGIEETLGLLEAVE